MVLEDSCTRLLPAALCSTSWILHRHLFSDLTPPYGLDDWWAGGLKAVWMKAEKHLSVGSVSMHPHWVRRCDASYTDEYRLAASQRSPGLVLLKEKYMTRRQVVTV